MTSNSRPTKTVSEELFRVLLRLEEMNIQTSPWLNKLPTFISSAIPVAIWLEHRGFPLSARDFWDIEFLRTDVFDQSEKNGAIFKLIAQPIRQVFAEITQEDLASMEQVSEEAMMRFGSHAMQAIRILSEDSAS
jgi:hypothetical protein